MGIFVVRINKTVDNFVLVLFYLFSIISSYNFKFLYQYLFGNRNTNGSCIFVVSLLDSINFTCPII